MLPDHVFQNLRLRAIASDDKVSFRESFADLWDHINKQVDSFPESQPSDHYDVDGIRRVPFRWVRLKLGAVNCIRND